MIVGVIVEANTEVIVEVIVGVIVGVIGDILITEIGIHKLGPKRYEYIFIIKIIYNKIIFFTPILIS